MIRDLNAEIIARLDARGGPAWEVIPGQYTPPHPVCGTYPTAGEADAALAAAGFCATGRSIPAPPLAPRYDQRTVMRFAPDPYADAFSTGVLLVRRRPPGPSGTGPPGGG